MTEVINAALTKTAEILKSQDRYNAAAKVLAVAAKLNRETLPTVRFR